MPSTYSPSLRIELIATGDQNGTWGITTDNNLGTLIEQAIVGVTTLDVTAGDITLTSLNGVTDQARSAVLSVIGTPGVTRVLTIPNVKKEYTVANGTASTVQVKTAGGSAFNCSPLSNSYIICDGANNTTGVSITASAAAVLAITNPFVNPVLTSIIEPTTIVASPATGTINFDVATQSILQYTTNATGNWTLNVRASASVALNTLMSTGQTISISFYATQGSPAYYENVFKIDGTTVTPLWQGGTTPSAGNVNSTDVYTYAITKTGAATFTVIASQTKFA